MAEPVTLSLWSEEDVRVGDVLSALESLRRPEPMPATRTSVLTLVIVASDRAAASRAQAAVHELGGRHPARVLTLVLDPSAGGGRGGGGIDAEIRLLGGEAEGRALWFEDVVLDVRGPVVGHLDSLIEPFTIGDLPVAVWFVDSLPEPDDPLLSAADVLLVDARELDDAAELGVVRSLSERLPVVDLSWVRLWPWRVLLAGLFEGPAFGPFVRGVRRAEVAGRTGPRLLLSGWLADRLSLPPGTGHVEPAEHVSIRLWCGSDDGRTATFSVVREGDVRRVSARASVEGGPSASAVLQLPEDTPAWGLADALSGLERDPIYDAALRQLA